MIDIISYYFRTIWNFITTFFYAPTNNKTNSDDIIREKTNQELEKWMVDQYANNVYLQYIPEKRKSDKYKEIYAKMKTKYG